MRLAARYDEEVNGSTKLGWLTTSFVDRGDRPRLGSGFPFFDDPNVIRELQANISRIEGWNQTKMCEYWELVCFFFPPHCRHALTPPGAPLSKDFQKSLTTDAIQGADIYHQLLKLRHGKNLPDAEVELIIRTFAENLQNYDQVVEVGGTG